ncbi:MAG: hypothetical protein IKX99_04390 [Lachnospiraceae bacterium]|nr:hypothetical protein [Lachnospiraceae bacterium]MBO4461589.1 hypothetical protein [Lachnospiraceae bacterium]MBR4794986.1 hypothetical protein [Lachnospiraceae bacterium]MBR5789322.1 hypothetical protein [Lachnospiraceae bacterium]
MDFFIKPDDKPCCGVSPEDKIKSEYPDARDADPEKLGHICEEHQDTYGICRICGRVIPGTMAAFDLLGEEPIEEE